VQYPGRHNRRRTAGQGTDRNLQVVGPVQPSVALYIDIDDRPGGLVRLGRHVDEVVVPVQVYGAFGRAIGYRIEGVPLAVADDSVDGWFPLKALWVELVLRPLAV